MDATAILLAAGLGTRMKSSLPKALHKLAGRPMLHHLLGSCDGVFSRAVVVIGPEMEAVARAAAPHPVAIQHERLGTAHAALQAAAEFGSGDVAVLYADNPLIRAETMRRLLAARAGAGLVLLAMRPADPARYGRVITHGDTVERVVEWADASATERQVGLCNAGVICASAADLDRWLRAVGNSNSKGEYYLTDVVAVARAEGVRVAAVEAPEAELRGVNSRAELAAAEATVQGWLRQAAMEAGATFTAPETVFLSADTVLAPDVTVAPNVVFGPGVSVARGAEIRAFCHLEGCTIGPDAIIGPFARLRPGTVVGAAARVGNFVEVKAAVLGDGAKVNHLSYIGDATVGAGSNVGAGAITVNYDGFGKHRTTVGEQAFVGANTSLIAPVTIGDRAMVVAGSTITEDVPPDAMALGRARQTTKPGRAAAFRASKKEKR